MKDRYQELLRQRQLVQEHLTWLDREISALASAPETVGRESESAAPSAAGSAENQADDSLAEYRPDVDSLQQRTRRGCLLIFVFSLCFLGAIAAAAYIWYTRIHGAGS